MTLRLLRLWARAVRMTRRPVPWLAQLRLLVTGRKVDRKRWRERMRTCQRCVIYDRVNRRCSARIGLRDMGCDCSMPIKALFDKSTCWARDNQLPFGWNERNDLPQPDPAPDPDSGP